MFICWQTWLFTVTHHTDYQGDNIRVNKLFSFLMSFGYWISFAPSVAPSDTHELSLGVLTDEQMKALCALCKGALCYLLVMACQISLQGPQFTFPYHVCVRLKISVSFWRNCLAFKIRYLETCHPDGLWSFWFGFLNDSRQRWSSFPEISKIHYQKPCIGGRPLNNTLRASSGKRME